MSEIDWLGDGIFCVYATSDELIDYWVETNFKVTVSPNEIILITPSGLVTYFYYVQQNIK